MAATRILVVEDEFLIALDIAGVLEQAGRRDEGLVHLEQALAICRECAWVHQHHGEMLLRAGRLFEAQQALERAVALDPDMALAHANLGVALIQRSQPSALFVGVAPTTRAAEFEASAKAAGETGLASIRERALMLGGDCKFHSERGKGTTVQVSIPVATAR